MSTASSQPWRRSTQSSRWATPTDIDTPQSPSTSTNRHHSNGSNSSISRDGFKMARKDLGGKGSVKDEMELLLSPSRGINNEDVESSLKNPQIQEKLKNHISMKLNRWNETYSKNRGSLSPEESKRKREELGIILLDLRKLREGIHSIQRIDTFACEVYEASVLLAIVASNSAQLASSLPHLVHTLHPALIDSSSPPRLNSHSSQTNNEEIRPSASTRSFYICLYLLHGHLLPCFNLPNLPSSHTPSSSSSSSSSSTLSTFLPTLTSLLQVSKLPNPKNLRPTRRSILKEQHRQRTKQLPESTQDTPSPSLSYPSSPPLTKSSSTQTTTTTSPCKSPSLSTLHQQPEPTRNSTSTSTSSPTVLGEDSGEGEGGEIYITYVLTLRRCLIENQFTSIIDMISPSATTLGSEEGGGGKGKERSSSLIPKPPIQVERRLKKLLRPSSSSTSTDHQQIKNDSNGIRNDGDEDDDILNPIVLLIYSNALQQNWFNNSSSSSSSASTATSPIISSASIRSSKEGNSTNTTTFGGRRMMIWKLLDRVYKIPIIDRIESSTISPSSRGGGVNGEGNDGWLKKWLMFDWEVEMEYLLNDEKKREVDGQKKEEEGERQRAGGMKGTEEKKKKSEEVNESWEDTVNEEEEDVQIEEARDDDLSIRFRLMRIEEESEMRTVRFVKRMKGLT